MMSRFLITLLMCFLLAVFATAGAEEAAGKPGVTKIEWSKKDAQGNIRVQFYFFWTASCPHCKKARPYIKSLAKKFPWLQVHSWPLSVEKNIQRYIEMANVMGDDASSVPGFIFCKTMLTGFDEEVTARQIEDKLRSCYQQLQGGTKPLPVKKPKNLVKIPGIGVVDADQLSLPVLTVVLAALDSFNPCAFFVLLFLLSLLVHARNRRRMLLIGGLFVAISGLVYFLFMAAWLNLFMLIGEMRWITLAAGVVAMFVALINIKDFFWFGRGVSLSIPDAAKPGLFQRMRGLLNADNLLTLMAGTIVLAVVANSYELLCTAGFPMVYTRALTLHQLPVSSYYLYLVFYNVVYVLPLLLIVAVFVKTLGSRKLKEREGRLLKLLSGTMMLGLGLILVFSPALLNNIVAAVSLLMSALVITAVVYLVTRRN